MSRYTPPTPTHGGVFDTTLPWNLRPLPLSVQHCSWILLIDHQTTTTLGMTYITVNDSQKTIPDQTKAQADAET